ncbi:unnamed protein product [Staurois parvus]|uniref:Uncharacterized protein n=1 Tax=Staurois parvus TaxID=386267 RepID=A0ABN9FCR4_9NEOB|nr:unnamed protein product [Staurois parvus]
MDPFMETNRYNVSTAVWRECPRTVRNSLFLTVVGHSLHTADEAVWRECPQNCRGTLHIHFLPAWNYFLFSSYFFFSFFILFFFF